MSPLVAGDPHLYGITADAIFVLVPLDDKKAKVLRIPTGTTTASDVKDAVFSTKGWTVESFVTVTNPTPPTPPTPPTEPTGKETCEDLVSCATNATTLSFSSCAVQAVACESKRPKDLVPTDSLTHGDEKGIKLHTVRIVLLAFLINLFSIITAPLVPGPPKTVAGIVD
jgi:hypothetical protein